MNRRVNMFAIVTQEKQKGFENQRLEKGISSEGCNVPVICGYYGRACRHMNREANTMLCCGCSLEEFSR